MTLEDKVPPEALALVAAEGGAMAVVLALAVYTLWRLLSGILTETRAQNAELIQAQAAAVRGLTEGVAAVETAVKLSDLHNQNALARVTENLDRAVVRLDRVDARLERHSDRISTIEVERQIAARAQPPLRNGVT